jgi:uncharacterized protein (TIGR03083 family)
MDELGAVPPGTDPIVALREECEAVSDIVKVLDDPMDFAKPTRCPAWNVKELLGHLYRDVDRINAGLDSEPPAGATHDAVSYFRSYDSTPGGAGARGVADRAKEVASRYASGRALAAAWTELWPATLDRASDADPSRVVVTFGPALTLEEYLKTRVLEVTVHRMDLDEALGRRGWGTDTAVSIVDDLLVGLLGTEPPRSLDWDVVDFIEAGTGRRELTDAERKTLGVRLAKRFPLMS